MALNAGIFGQVGQGVRSVQDYDLQAQQLQNSQLAGQQNRLALLLNQQKADEYQRGVQEQNRLRGVSQGWSADTTDDQRIAGLKNAGFFSQADALEKGLLERQKTGAEVGYKTAQTQGEAVKNKGAEYDLKRKKFEHTVQGLSQFQSAQQAKEWLADSIAGGMMDEAVALKMVSAMPNDSAQFAQWRDSGVLALMDAGKQAGFIRPDANAQLSSQTSIATNRATNERTAADNAAARAVQMRGQNLTDSRSREANTIQKEAARTVLQETPDGFVLVDKGTGQVRVPTGADGKPIAGKGGSTKVSDAKDVISLLDQAEPLIGKATNSYAGQGIDQAARVVGMSTPGAQAAAELRALEGALISKMPKMSGPQSDKDVLLYKQMAGQIGDPTIPADTKRAAMRTIRTINERHAGGGSAPAPIKSGTDLGGGFKVK